MTTKKLAGKPKGNAIVPIPFPTPTRCLTQTPGALKREKSQRSDTLPQYTAFESRIDAQNEKRVRQTSEKPRFEFDNRLFRILRHDWPMQPPNEA